MTVETIAHMDWEVTELSGGRLYTNTTGEITGVAHYVDARTFSFVVMVDDETSPRHVYDNFPNAEWNAPTVWGILTSLGEDMYDVEQELIEESYDDLYEIDERYDDYDDYEYENDSDLHNEY